MSKEKAPSIHRPGAGGQSSWEAFLAEYSRIPTSAASNVGLSEQLQQLGGFLAAFAMWRQVRAMHRYDKAAE